MSMQSCSLLCCLPVGPHACRRGVPRSPGAQAARVSPCPWGTQTPSFLTTHPQTHRPTPASRPQLFLFFLGELDHGSMRVTLHYVIPLTRTLQSPPKPSRGPGSHWQPSLGVQDEGVPGCRCSIPGRRRSCGGLCALSLPRRVHYRFCINVTIKPKFAPKIAPVPGHPTGTIFSIKKQWVYVQVSYFLTDTLKTYLWELRLKLCVDTKS